MGITISGVSIVQGTGVYVKDSVLEVSYTLAADGTNLGHAFDIEAQFKLTTALPGWATAYLHPDESNSAVVHTAIAAGAHKVLVRVPVSLSQAGIAAPYANYANQLVVQIRAKDRTTGEYSGYVDTGAATTLKAAQPTVTTATMPHYIGGVGTGATVAYNNVTVTLAGSNQENSPGNPSYYRISQNIIDLADGTGVPTAFTASPTYAFSSSDPDGEKPVLVKLYDQYYNSSALREISYDGTDGHRPWLQKARPSAAKIRIVGSVGNEFYTGIDVNTDDTLTVDRNAHLYVAATSLIGMTFRILPTSNVELTSNVDTDITYNAGNATQIVALTTDQAHPANDNFNTDANVTVLVDVSDLAGNKVSLSATIRLNTRIYLTHHTPLRAEDSMYRHQLWEVGSGGNQTSIPRSPQIANAFVRAWPDIFFPITHRYPTDEFGVMDQAASLAMTGATASYDLVQTQVVNGTKVIYFDSQNRAATVGWTMDGSKACPPMLSSSVANLQYWAIDNTGYGDFQLEFEWFDLNPQVFGPPYNPLAPYRGDVLVVYDATAAGAVTASDDPLTGNKKYVLADSTKLREIAAYTGSGANVLNLTSGGRMNSNTQGGFKSDWIRNVPILLVVLYTDAGGNASGFKLKSSWQHQQVWSDFDVDEKNGQLWIHKYASIATAAGAADTTVKQLTYDYMDRDVEVNCETGVVTFQSDPGGEVRVDATYYTGTTWPGTTFLASEDDFVAYMDANIYVLPTGTSALTDTIRSKLLTTDGYGRVTAGATWNSDGGTLEFAVLGDLPTNCRIMAEYTHHTFKRISADGYGDLTFVDPIVVADNTPAYPDYTYADIMLVNEGDSMLEQGKLVFVARGYDTDGQDGVVLTPDNSKYKTNSDIVDQVLDINRPWDIQRGTKDETYDRMAVAFSGSFIWQRGCAKSGGTDPNNQTAAGILATWKNQAFGNLAARDHLYGRAVWAVCGTSGSDYPQATTQGVKRCSFEISGKYYTNLVV